MVAKARASSTTWARLRRQSKWPVGVCDEVTKHLQECQVHGVQQLHELCHASGVRLLTQTGSCHHANPTGQHHWEDEPTGSQWREVQLVRVEWQDHAHDAILPQRENLHNGCHAPSCRRALVERSKVTELADDLTGEQANRCGRHVHLRSLIACWLHLWWN